MNHISFQCRHEFESGFQLELEFDSDKPIVALFGPSGSGKTSILSMMVGFVAPAAGRIQLGERVLFDSAQRINIPCERRNIGLVAQDHLVFPHLNVEANLKYGQRRGGANAGPQAADLLQRVCSVLELTPLLTRYPRNLSGGESQRVSIGRALMSHPQLLLLDEPLSSLDAGLESQILEYLEQIIAEMKIPVIFVSHRQGHVRRLADWVVVMEAGSKIAEGVPEQALTHFRPLSWTKTSGPVNLLAVDNVRLDGDRWTGIVGDQRLHLPIVERAADRMIMQFTPRDVTLSRRDVEGLSARNHLAGTIRQIVPAPHAAFVAIDIGQMIWAEVTPQSVRELELHPGSMVTCLIKAQSMEAV